MLNGNYGANGLQNYFWLNNQKLFLYYDFNTQTEFELLFMSYLNKGMENGNVFNTVSKIVFSFRNKFRKTSRIQYDLLYYEFLNFYKILSGKFKKLIGLIKDKNFKELSEFDFILFNNVKKMYLPNEEKKREKSLTIRLDSEFYDEKQVNIDFVKILIEVSDNYSGSLDLKKQVVLDYVDFYNFLMVCNEISKNFLILSAQCSNFLSYISKENFPKYISSLENDVKNEVVNDYEQTFNNTEKNKREKNFNHNNIKVSSDNIYDDEILVNVGIIDESKEPSKVASNNLIELSKDETDKNFMDFVGFVKKFENIKTNDYFGTFILLDEFFKGDFNLFFNFLESIFEKKKFVCKEYFYPSIILYENYLNKIFKEKNIEDIYYIQYLRNILLYLPPDKYRINYFKFKMETLDNVSSVLVEKDSFNELVIYITEVLFLLAIFKSFHICNKNKSFMSKEDEEMFNRLSLYYRYFFILFGIDVATILSNVINIKEFMKEYIVSKIRIIFDKYIYFGFFKELNSRFLRLFINGLMFDGNNIEHFENEIVFSYIEKFIYDFVNKFESICLEVKEFNVGDKNKIINLLKKEEMYVPESISSRDELCVKNIQE